MTIPPLDQALSIQNINHAMVDHLNALHEFIMQQEYIKAFDEADAFLIGGPSDPELFSRFCLELEKLLPRLPFERKERLLYLGLLASKRLPTSHDEHVFFLKHFGMLHLNKESTREKLLSMIRSFATAYALKPDDEIHQHLSRPFFYLALQGFQSQLGKVSGLEDTTHFEKLLDRIPEFHQKFSQYPEDIREFYSVARGVYQEITNDTTRNKYSFLTFRFNEGDASSEPLKNRIPLTASYRNALNQIREHFENPQKIRFFQKKRSEEYRTFFRELIEDAIFILGEPPCKYEIRVMGSLDREEICPYSDFEYYILIKSEEQRLYFQELAEIIDLQILSLGETSPKHQGMFDFGQKSGLQIDDTGNPAIKTSLIGKPQELFVCNKSNPNELKAYKSKLRSCLLHSNHTFEPLEHDLQEDAKKLLLMRLEDFQDLKILQSSECDIKKEFMEPLFHFLGDLGLYFGIEESNTLDIIERLPLFDAASRKVLQEAVVAIYRIRVRIQLFHQGIEDERASIEPQSLGLPVLTEEEKTALVLAHQFAIRPLYSLDLEEELGEVDLIRLAFERAKTPEEMNTFVQGLQHFSLEYLLPSFYEELSRNFETPEILRQAFIDAIDDSNLKHEIALIPNTKSYRQIERLKREELHESILNILSPGEEKSKDGYSVLVTGPTFEMQKLCLKKSLIEEIIDLETGDLKKTYQNTNSRVTLSEEHGLHFKQAPTNPDKESPFHPGKERAVSSLMFRLFGHGTSVGELIEFTVLHSKGNKSYLVHISKTIPGTNLADATPEMLQNINPHNLSDFFLSLPLLLPGDMRPANMILQEDRLISIDNDVAWVRPMTKGAIYGYNYNLYTILPFLFPQHVLDQSSLDQLLSLRPGPLLVDWLEELAAYNKRAKTHFSKFEDISKGITVRALFEKETGGQIFSQCARLQAFLREAQESISALDILKCIISFHEKQTTDIGQKLYERYAEGQAQKGTPSEQVKWVTARDAKASMSMTKSQASFYKNLPTSEEKLQDYTPEKLFKEISDLLTLDFGNFFFQNESCVARLEKGFEDIPDPAQQETLLKSLIQHRYEALNLSHSSVLTDEILSHFLRRSQETLRTLVLRHCPKLTEKVVSLISNCTNLEELYLSHSKGIKRFSIARTARKDLQVSFPNLKVLHIANTSLERLYFDAPQLEYLKINDNPNLKDTEFKLSYPCLVQRGENPIPEGAFGKMKWERHFGDIGVEPPLPPDIFEILNSTCPFRPPKKVYETHLLVLVPEAVDGKPLTLNTLEKLIKSPKTGIKNKYRYYDTDVRKEHGDTSLESHWVLMTRDVIPNSRRKKYDEHKQMIADIDNRWAVPKALEAAVGILMHHVEKGVRLFYNEEILKIGYKGEMIVPDEAWTYTRCEEKVNQNRWWVYIGCSAAGGLDVHYDFNENVGAAALRKFRT